MLTGKHVLQILMRCDLELTRQEKAIPDAMHIQRIDDVPRELSVYILQELGV